jgi:hypothetical protein
MDGVELGGRDDFGELLHVDGLDVDNVEALVADVEVPQVDPEVVGGYVGLAVRVYGDRVDVVGMGVGVHFARNRRGDRVVRRHAREPQLRLQPPDAASEVLAVVVLGNDLDLLVEHLPELDCLVVRAEEEVSGILALAPPNAVDLLLNLERLEVVKLGLV